MLTLSEFNDFRILSSYRYQELKDFISASDTNLNETVRVLCVLAQEVLELRENSKVENKAMEIVAHFIKDHDLFSAALSRLQK